MSILKYAGHVYHMFIDIAPYMLLGLFFVGLLHIFFSKEFIIKHVGENSILSALKASVLGVPLPLCSCGVIPTAVYMAKSGASRGAVISFLISTPQTGIDSIIATYGMMGPIFAIYRPIVAFLSGIIGGVIVNIFSVNDIDLEALNKKSQSGDDEHCHDHKNDSCSTETAAAGDCGSSCCSHETVADEKGGKLKRLYNFAFKEFLDDITVHFIVGLLIAGLISYLVPADFFMKYNLTSGPLAMALVIAAGIPMYICATSSIPIGVALLMKGVSPGVVFVFLSVGPLTNAASLAVLYKILKSKIIAIYITVSVALAVIGGLLLDLMYYKLNIPLDKMIITGSEHSAVTEVIFKISAVIFLAMLLISLYRKYIKGKFNSRNRATT